MEIDKHVPKDWKRDLIKRGRGVRWYDGKGNSISINYGYNKDVTPGTGTWRPIYEIFFKWEKNKSLFRGES